MRRGSPPLIERSRASKSALRIGYASARCFVRAHQRAADARRNYLHHVSKWLVANYDLIAYEDLKIGNMSRSASGTVEQPGKNVAAKSGLNRSIMDAAWAVLLYQLRYKAENAGVHVIAVNPRGTSQRCSQCGETVSKTIAQRRHICTCGADMDRDHNAALNVFALGISAAGV